MVVLQKIKALQIECIDEQSPRGKDVEHSPFLCGNDSYAVITCSIFSAQNFLQHYPFTDAAKLAGRKSGDAVAHLISRFNREGLPALETRHGGGPPFRYTSVECERILREFCRPPDRRLDGTATWSLVTLQRALRRAPDGLPRVSTQTIGCVLHEAGYW